MRCYEQRGNPHIFTIRNLEARELNAIRIDSPTRWLNHPNVIRVCSCAIMQICDTRDEVDMR